MQLAGIVFEPGEGGRIDGLLAELAKKLRQRGATLAGGIQRSVPGRDGCRCDVLLLDLATGREIAISEDRGPLARGCRLDNNLLETQVGATLTALEQGADLLIVNRFGKCEVEGRGFRPAIAMAAAEGIPVLVAIGRPNCDHWRDFAGGLGVELAPEPASLEAWCRARLALPGPDAAETRVEVAA
jgi:nucleoside-triphosphatase THEP1